MRSTQEHYPLPSGKGLLGCLGQERLEHSGRSSHTA